MKTLLIIDSGLGQARAYMAKTLLGAAANKAHLEMTDNPGDAELAIVLGDKVPADSALNGKKVWLGDINRAVAHPELFLSECYLSSPAPGYRTRCTAWRSHTSSYARQKWSPG